MAVLAVARGYYWADAVASIFVASIIAVGGIYLFRDNVHYLLGRAPATEVTQKIVETVKSADGVLGVHDLRTEYVGPNMLHAGLHIEVAKGTSIEEADRIAGEVNRRVAAIAGCQHCVIHVEPAGVSAHQ